MKLRALALAIVLIALSAAIPSLVAMSPAQPPAGSPPGGPPRDEKPKNLKVLPKDMDLQQVRAVMGGFTRALGVRCDYCHAVKDGHPDFPSDDNPKKNIARGMLRMTDSVNVQIAKILPADHPNRVNVQCVTCHRGLAHPRTLIDELNAKYDAAGTDSALAKYKMLREQYYGSGSYDFGPGTLPEVARHAYQGKQDSKSAIALLQFNVQQFPDNSTAHGSLAEGYLSTGDTTKAIAELEQSVKLDPHNERAARTLDRLKKK